jgi:hypothetical protein
MFVGLLLLASCSRSGAPVTPPKDAPGSSQSMPMPGTSTPLAPIEDPTSTPDVANPFSVLVRNCYLVDPDINPVGAPESREKGIRMVVTGSIRNNSERIIHRAGVYSKLVVFFGKNARFEKYSGGLGFDPPVTSSNPWRPGAWRDFEIVGRAFDPIYREYEPRAISGVLSLEAKDPLGFSFSQEIARMKPRWETLFGIATDTAAPVSEAIKLTYGPNNIKTEIKPEEQLKLIAQQGGAYLAVKNDKLIGWIPDKNVAVRQYESMYPENAARTFPMMATSQGRYEITVTDYRYLQEVQGLPEADGGYMALHVKVKTLAQRQALPLHPNYFWVDEGSGRFSTALEKVTGAPDALPVVEHLAPGSESSGWIYCPRHDNGWPFALVFQPSKTADPTHILIFPAITREGAKKTIAPAEEPQT